MTNYDTIPGNLKILRAVYDFTQTKMGEAVGKNQSSISQLLRTGDYGALFDQHLQILAQLFKTDLRTILLTSRDILVS